QRKPHLLARGEGALVDRAGLIEPDRPHDVVHREKPRGRISPAVRATRRRAPSRRGANDDSDLHVNDRDCEVCRRPAAERPAAAGGGGGCWPQIASERSSRLVTAHAPAPTIPTRSATPQERLLRFRRARMISDRRSGEGPGLILFGGIEIAAEDTLDDGPLG